MLNFEKEAPDSAAKKVASLRYGNGRPLLDLRTVQRSALCRSRRELSNEHLLAKFGFDTGNIVLF